MSTHVFNAIESEVFVRGDGIDHRVSVKAASTASVDLALNLAGSSIDGVTVNAGDRVLLKDQAATAEVTTITCAADVADSLDGTHFLLNSASGTQYYVWYDTPAGAGDPAVAGRTGIQVVIATGALANAVAAATASAIDTLGDFAAPAPGANVVTVTDQSTGPVEAAVDVDTGFAAGIVRTTRGTSAIDNGIWEIGSGAGMTYRAEDLVDGDDAAFVFVDVQDGVEYEKTQWTCCDKSGNADVGTDPLTWAMSQLFKYAANDLFYATSSTEMDTIGSTASQVLVTDGSGVPQWSDYLPTGTNISGPFTMGDQIVNKEYVDGIAAGLDPKESVVLRTLTDIGGAYNAAGGTGGTGAFTGVDLTDAAAFDIDAGVVLDVGERVLIMNQTDAKQNGIYVVTVAGAAGELERAPDMDGSPANEVSGGNHTFTETGATYEGTGWVLIGEGDLTLNTDDLNWTQFSTVGDWNAGDGIDITGNTVSTDLFPNGGIVYNGATPSGQLQVDVGASAITGVLEAEHGGTGHSMYDHGDLLVGNDSNPDTLNKLSAQSMGVLTVDYFAGAPGGPGVVNWSNDVNLNNILGVSASEPELLVFSNSDAAVNHIQMSNALTANNPAIKAVGDDADISLDLMSKGTGAIGIMGDTNPGAVRFWNEADTFYTELKAQTVANGLTANVSFCLPVADGNANDILITDGAGVLSFQTLNAITRDSHSLMALEVKANSVTASPIAYFAWHEAEYNDVGTVYLLYEVTLSNRNITIELYDETNASIIASVTHSVAGFYTLDVSGILSIGGDARLSVRVNKSSSGGMNPSVFGIQIVFNPADTPADN